MTQSQRTEFAEPPTEAALKPTSNNTAVMSSNMKANAAGIKHSCDILLNNFQIKKKRYRVLFNCDHIVWDRLEGGKRKHDDGEKITPKEAEIETEQLSNKAAYGVTSNVLHLDEIIRVAQGNSKSATIQNTPAPPDILDATPPQQQPQNEPLNAATTPMSCATEQYLTIHYAERRVRSPIDCNRWRLRTLTLFNADPHTINRWHTLLTHALSKSTRLRVQRLLVFINPYGGRQQGLETYERYCKPVFQLAGIDASCIISQRSNQIRDILMSHDLAIYDAVCCVGGDGTVAEVINGLLFRRIRDLGMNVRQPAYIPRPELPIGIIPAGSTDTVAYSLHGTSDPRTAAIHVVLGQRRGVDICSVRNRQGIVRFCASVLSYGYLGDVAAKSEKYRWMGTKRYEYTGVKAFLANRGYEAELRLLEEEEKPETEAAAGAETSKTVCTVNCQRCSSAVPSSFVGASSTKGTLEQHSASDNDVEQPTSSNLSLYAQKSNDDNTSVHLNTKCSHVEDKSNSLYSDDVDNIRNINMADCDRNCKAVVLEQQLQKHHQIKELLAAENKCDTQCAQSLDHSQAVLVEPQKLPCLTLSTETETATAQTNATIFDSNSSLDNDNVSGLMRKPQNIEPNHKWKVIKGNFFMISGANITCACSRSPNGISRYSHLGDGYLDLILVRKTSLLNNIRFVVNTMGRNGDIRNLPFVEVYRTKKFAFRAANLLDGVEDYNSVRGSCQPIADTSNDEDEFSNWNCDGEVVNDLDITMSSHCQLIDVFMRGPHTYNRSAKNEHDNSCFNCCKREN